MEKPCTSLIHAKNLSTSLSWQFYKECLFLGEERQNGVFLKTVPNKNYNTDISYCYGLLFNVSGNVKNFRLSKIDQHF